MAIWKKQVSVDVAQKRCEHTLVDHVGIEFTEVTEDTLSAKMPVDHRTRQPIGIMHGGSSCLLAETVGSVAANFAVDDEHYCVGLSINTSHLKSIREGFVYACAKPVHIGRSTHVWQIDIVNDKQQMISSNRLTMMVLAR